jgi:hypothetical protein
MPVKEKNGSRASRCTGAIFVFYWREETERVYTTTRKEDDD